MIGDIAIGVRPLAVKKWLSTGKTVLDTVPKGDAGLADLPAKKHHFGAEHTRKIDQSLLDSFAHATIGIDLFNPTLNLADESCDLAILTQLLHQIGCLRIKPLLANDGFTDALQPADIVENLLYQRPKCRQQLISFIDRKKSLILARSIHESSLRHRPVYLKIT